MAQLENIIRYLGIDTHSHLVIYDDEGGGWAGRFAWTLDLLGFQNWSYLNGGIVAWIKEGFVTEAEANQPVRLGQLCEYHQSSSIDQRRRDYRPAGSARFCRLGCP